MEGEGRSEGTEERSLTALWVQALLVFAAGVIGFWGWMALYGSPPYSEFKPYSDFWPRVWDSLAATLGLYATSFSLPPIPADPGLPKGIESEMALLNWQLIVARILAPLSLVLVVTWTLVQAFFGTSLRIRATRRGLSRSHSGLVLCGHGELIEETAIEESKRAGRKPGLGFLRRWFNAAGVTARQYLRRGCRKSSDGAPEYWPIVIVSAYQPDRLAEMRTLGIKWIPADARRQDILRSLGVYRARTIAALDPEVSWNTDVALRAERVASMEGQIKSHIVARAGRDPVIPWTHEEGVEDAIAVTPFDFDDIAARAIFEQFNPFPGLDRGICQGKHVLVVATDEPVGDSLIIEGIRSWVAQHPQHDGLLGKRALDRKERKRWKEDSLRVLLIGTNAKERVERILKHQPEIPSLLGNPEGADSGKPVIAGWERQPEYVGDDAEWFSFEADNLEAKIGPREVPTVLIYSMNRHRAVRAARDTGALPKIRARQGRVAAITESGPLDEHLKQAENFETVDAGRLLSSVALYVDGGFEQRLARSLHARWRQKGSRKSIGADNPSEYFRQMLGTWEELSQEEEAQWLLLAEYLLDGREPVDRKLDALEPWERDGIRYVVGGLMRTLRDEPPTEFAKALDLVNQLEIDRYPDLVPGAFLEAGMSLKENEWASSLSRAVLEAQEGTLEASSRRVAEAFRRADDARVDSNQAIGEMILAALEQERSSARKAAGKDWKKAPKGTKAAFDFVRNCIERIGEARKGVQ